MKVIAYKKSKFLIDESATFKQNCDIVICSCTLKSTIIRFENLPKCLSSDKNKYLKISHS